MDSYPDGVPDSDRAIHFKDQLHLNREGAETFSHYLAKFLEGAFTRLPLKTPTVPAPYEAWEAASRNPSR